jgi:hypothetical protein
VISLQDSFVNNGFSLSLHLAQIEKHKKNHTQLQFLSQKANPLMPRLVEYNEKANLI